MADTTTNLYKETIEAVNPISTVTLKDADWGAQHRLGQVAAGDTLTFTVKTYPAVFSVQGVGATAAKNASGFIFVNAAAKAQVSGTHLAVSGTTADDLVVTISSGVVTLTSPATSETKTDVWISRIL